MLGSFRTSKPWAGNPVLAPALRRSNEFAAVAQAQTIFDENFLTIRAKLIEVAAALDRLDRAAEDDGESVEAIDDLPRRPEVEEAIRTLLRGSVEPGQRAASLQRLFSRAYEPDWRQRFRL